MALTLIFTCTQCDWKHGDLTRAEQHAQALSHIISVRGTVTPKITFDVQKIEAAAEKKLRDGLILRLARDKGLLK